MLSDLPLVDREVLLLWATDAPSEEIGLRFSKTPVAIRQQVSRIRRSIAAKRRRRQSRGPYLASDPKAACAIRLRGVAGTSDRSEKN